MLSTLSNQLGGCHIGHWKVRQKNRDPIKETISNGRMKDIAALFVCWLYSRVLYEQTYSLWMPVLAGPQDGIVISCGWFTRGSDKSSAIVSVCPLELATQMA